MCPLLGPALFVVTTLMDEPSLQHRSYLACDGIIVIHNDKQLFAWKATNVLNHTLR